MNFVENYSIFQHYSTLIVHIKLGSWLFLAIFQRHTSFLVLLGVSHIINRNELGLVTTAPNNDVGINQVRSLLFDSLGLHKSKSFLLAVGHISVEFFGVSSESSE